MSLLYYLVCHEKEIAVVIGDDAAGVPFIWQEQKSDIDTFLTLTKGHPLICVHEEDKGFDDWIDKYEILGKVQ